MLPLPTGVTQTGLPFSVGLVPEVGSRPMPRPISTCGVSESSGTSVKPQSHAWLPPVSGSVELVVENA